MNDLIVGANSFIGSHLVDKLLAAGWNVVLELHERRNIG